MLTILLVVLLFVFAYAAGHFKGEARHFMDQLDEARLAESRAREAITTMGDALREGLTDWPRIADRAEFVRWCIQEHKRIAVEQQTGSLPQSIQEALNSGDGVYRP